MSVLFRDLGETILTVPQALRPGVHPSHQARRIVRVLDPTPLGDYLAASGSPSGAKPERPWPRAATA